MKMAGEESSSKTTLHSGPHKIFTRSSTWTDRSPRKPDPKPKSKNRARLPPLQPIVVPRDFEEWPSPGSDDTGVWLSSPLPKFLTPRENSTSIEKKRDNFTLPRDKLAFFKKECSKIVDYIYLGSDTIAKNKEILVQNGITHVLNCVGFVCPEYFKEDFVYKTLWLHDSPSEDITSVLYDVFDYFENVRELNGRVFVHCCQGVSRSTSMVIAYLMWKEARSFDEAFSHVKKARGITNPNMGFACQLLQCQKRVHALPASPSSVLRMYRLAPHSPYDPLHLVPKRLSETGPTGLDSRGAFIIHIPLAIYVWIGKYCVQVMEDHARASARQVIRYEKAVGPAEVIYEGHEPSEFWEALGGDLTGQIGQRKIDSYDLDFEVFYKAYSGGIVPPFPPENGSEMCVPVRESGWSLLRRKFIQGIVKIFVNEEKSKLFGDSKLSPKPKLLPNILELPKQLFRDTLQSPKPKSNYESPNLSPSVSEYSNIFTFSPSSSYCSDSPYVSAVPSPTTEFKGFDSPPEGALSTMCAQRTSNSFSPSGENSRSDEDDEIMKDVECEKTIEESTYLHALSNDLAERVA